ncbi:MAG: recombination mediator RecR [Planctomycetaceae bacterium]|jgi:recombination protein RecR|nr:recombination mediator RecR [Planctomycetaceae bacterium]
MSEITESVTRMMQEFEKLPGLGRKSAERIAYHLLKIDKDEAFALADSIRTVKENVRYCEHCFNLTENELCDVCRNPQRRLNLLCVVEQPRDLIALEQTGHYDGLYHVLLGRLSPLDTVGPKQLTIDALIERIKSGTFSEIIMGTNPTVEGDSTAVYIIKELEAMRPSLPQELKITRLARGLTTGSDLQFANNEMLADALSGRQELR